MRKIGIRYYDTNLTEESFREMADGGMSATEIDLVNEPENLDYRKVRELADSFGIHIWSTHLPFKDEWCLVQKTEEARKRAYDLQCLMIERATDIGVDKFISHPSFIIHKEDDREECLKQTKDAHFRLAEFATARGAVIAVENMIPCCLGNCTDELMDIVNVNDKLKVCFDTNHLLIDTHEELVEKLGDRIITCHISDYDFVKERHWFPGEGKLDWPKIYSLFNEIGYEGVWMYELSPGTVNDFRSRPLTVRDFYNNAIEIFAGKQPSRV